MHLLSLILFGKMKKALILGYVLSLSVIGDSVASSYQRPKGSSPNVADMVDEQMYGWSKKSKKGRDFFHEYDPTSDALADGRNRQHLAHRQKEEREKAERNRKEKSKISGVPCLPCSKCKSKSKPKDRT